MKEKFQNGLKKVKDLYVGEKKNKYIMITAIALVVVIAVSVILALVLNNRPYETLVTQPTKLRRLWENWMSMVQRTIK